MTIGRRVSSSTMKKGGDSARLAIQKQLLERGDSTSTSKQVEDIRAPWLTPTPQPSINPKKRKADVLIREGPKDAATLLNELVDYIDQENITDLESGILCVELDFIVHNVLCAELKRVAISPNKLSLRPFLEYWSQYTCQALFNCHPVAAHVIQ